VTKFTAILHAGSLVSCHDLLSLLLCFNKWSRTGTSYFKSKIVVLLNCFWSSPAVITGSTSHRTHELFYCPATLGAFSPPPHFSLIDSQSQSYFTTGGLPPISSFWCQARWGSWPEIASTHPLKSGWFVSYEYALSSIKRMYHTHNMLLKILPFLLYTSPLSVPALQSRSGLSYLSYAMTAA
jgi:hypothetical protein